MPKFNIKKPKVKPIRCKIGMHEYKEVEVNKLLRIKKYFCKNCGKTIT